MSRSGLTLALGAAALVLAAGCGTRTDPPAGDDAKAAASAAEVAQHLGVTVAATADAMVKIVEPGRDAQSFHVYLYCDDDGAVRVVAQLKTVEFCSALLQADGRYLAWLPRAKAGARGDLDDEPEQGGLLAVLRQAASELTAGPIPPAARIAAGPAPGTVLAVLPTGLTAQLTLDAGTRTVTAKRLLDGEGRELVRIAYERYRPSDELTRATIVRLTMPDGVEATVMVQKFEPLGGISDETMRLALPDGALLLPLREFLARMGE